MLNVIEHGARDDARSEMLTAAIEGQGLGTPIEIIASASRLWLFAEDEPSESRVAVALPDGVPVPIGPGSMTGVIKDGDDLIVATDLHILRVRPDGTEVLGDGWIPKGMLSARDHHVSAAVKERPSQKITLTTFEDGKAQPFLPELRLKAE